MASLCIAKIRHVAVRAMHRGIQIRHLEEDRVLVRGSQEDFVLRFFSKIRVIESPLPNQGPHPGGRGGNPEIESGALFLDL